MSIGLDSSPPSCKNDGPMKVIFAVLADAANVSQEGKLNILGNFANINATTFPAQHPEMNLVLRLEASPAEVGTKKKLEVQLIGEDGQRIGGLNADFEVPPPRSAGEPINMQSVVRLVGIVFPKAGRYAMHILINEEEKADIPLTVGGQ